ncbi:MAG: UDP-N-acetylmuramate--L-alanine ligase [Clostridia bacterium]|nr:UDP-N-acetylmuramate--L-alanine ligase [Clostridia bacterium]
MSLNSDILHDVSHIHFVGIGGSGMSPLVEILHTLGYTITGSDNNESDNIKRISQLERVSVQIGHRAENVNGAEMLVYTSAVSQDNPELIAAREAGIPLIERAKLLGMISKRFSNTVAVAGTHGKTTVTSMISQILLEADKDPTLFIGGRLPLIQANGRAGQSDTMICEACEFQNHYLEMQPAISLILNVDADHLEFFGDLDGVIRSFATFASQTTGKIIYNADDANTCRALADVPAEKLISYSLTDAAEWHAVNAQINGAYGEYDLFCGDRMITHVRLGVPGVHNIANSVGAAAAATLCGATPAEIADGLLHFRGAGRRFEILGEFGGVTVVDDYAHHPTEIQATLSTAKQMPFNRVWAVFQPFTFSRTARLLDDFATALSVADIAVVSDIMGSREVNTWNVYAEQITEQMQNGIHIPDFKGITDYVVSHVQPGDLVVSMGGGDVYKCARMIVAELEKK